MKIKGKMPKMEKREPWDIPGENRHPMYMESDNDYISHNVDACVWFLDNYEAIKKLLTKVK